MPGRVVKTTGTLVQHWEADLVVMSRPVSKGADRERGPTLEGAVDRVAVQPVAMLL